MALINDVGRDESIADDDAPTFQIGHNHLGYQFRPAGHEQESFRPRTDVGSRGEEDPAKLVTEWSPARIEAAYCGNSIRIQPVDQEPALRRLAGAIDAIERDKWSECHESSGTISSA